MTVCVVDSSVAMKWYVPEVHSREASSLLDQDHELHAPDLFFAEFANILWKKTRRQELSHDESRQILMALASVPIQIHPSETLLDSALDTAIAYSRSVYDCLYLALAGSLGCRAVTADERLVNALQNTAISGQIIHVRDWQQ